MFRLKCSQNVFVWAYKLILHVFIDWRRSNLLNDTSQKLNNQGLFDPLELFLFRIRNLNHRLILSRTFLYQSFCKLVRFLQLSFLLLKVIQEFHTNLNKCTDIVLHLEFIWKTLNHWNKRDLSTRAKNYIVEDDFS